MAPACLFLRCGLACAWPRRRGRRRPAPALRTSTARRSDGCCEAPRRSIVTGPLAKNVPLASVWRCWSDRLGFPMHADFAICPSLSLRARAEAPGLPRIRAGLRDPLIRIGCCCGLAPTGLGSIRTWPSRHWPPRRSARPVLKRHEARASPTSPCPAPSLHAILRAHRDDRPSCAYAHSALPGERRGESRALCDRLLPRRCASASSISRSESHGMLPRRRVSAQRRLLCGEHGVGGRVQRAQRWGCCCGSVGGRGCCSGRGSITEEREGVAGILARDFRTALWPGGDGSVQGSWFYSLLASVSKVSHQVRITLSSRTGEGWREACACCHTLDESPNAGSMREHSPSPTSEVHFGALRPQWLSSSLAYPPS